MEHVKERARQEEQTGKGAEHVGRMLRHEEETRDPEKAQQDETRARPKPGAPFR
jgi:hypothetical protein